MTQDFDDLKATLGRIDAATTNIANDIRTLLDKIGTSMTPEQVAELKASFGAAADTLEATAAEVPEA